ncbi:ANTAR domain-containing protein [Nocardia sp. NEAU-G5]|jgi:hypothetical protein|uniref:ANTAR domain-containing protein n=1 Tax=Nocardia albiluteola TaxID=2842303 RepID=A0ABS6ASE1_9NOCA|nr:ANTAR domain-containing protein [Nocardia albiluteola]MBU3059953.1 ANTAR domain-containing protein [Nocardia albiluteola]
MTKPAIETFHRNDARMLDTAEGVLVALRRYSPADAFAEILDTAHQHRVPALGLARALVELAGADAPAVAPGPAAVAHTAWGHLFARAAEVPAPA